MIEEWRAVVGYEGRYEVSSLGRVRSYVTNRWATNEERKAKVLRTALGNHGYFVASLRKDGETKRTFVHHMVAEAFHGPRPDGMLALHDNDVRTDNRSAKLYWGTKSDNALDAVRNGRLRMPRAKLTSEQVREIRVRLSRGEQQKLIASAYSVHPSTISLIATRDHWKHL